MQRPPLRNNWIKNNQQNERTFRIIFSKLWSDYTKKNTLDCINYLGDSRKHWLERLVFHKISKFNKIFLMWIYRLFWALIFIISMYFCTLLILQRYQKFKAVPIITSPDQFSTLISDIPFPAVTMCPEIKANISEFDWFKKFQEFHQNSNNVTDQEWAINIKWVCIMQSVLLILQPRKNCCPSVSVSK